jgi:hypothetical protein
VLTLSEKEFALARNVARLEDTRGSIAFYLEECRPPLLRRIALLLPLRRLVLPRRAAR